MREIKFRAWHKTVHTMTSVAVIDFQQEELCEEYTYFPEADWHSLSCYDLMQFTGLLDKNGKEIFEGDIVTAEWHWKTPHKIVWPDDYYTFVEYSLDEASIEVIGNIYENKDLLPEDAEV